MAIQPFNICQGPATLRWAPFGATEPADSAVTTAPNSAVWTDVGGTADGTSILMEVDLTYTDLAMDQLIDQAGARLTKRMVQITAALEEATLANLNLATNQLNTISVQSNYTTLDPLTGLASSQPTYTALIIDGWAPTLSTGSSARRRIILRKTISQAKVALEYEKSKPNLFNCTFTSYYISSGIAPYHLVDQTA